MTKKQKQEIDFLCEYFRGEYKDAEQYIQWTVNGKEKGGDNSLFQAKRGLDICIKMWTEDMQKGQLAYFELLEDFDNCEYIKKIIGTIRKNLSPLPHYGGLEDVAKLGFLNSKFGLALE